MRPKKDYQGFTLMEIIILIILAGILLPAIVVPFIAGIKGSGAPEMATKAMYLAQQKLEEFLQYAYDQPPLQPIALTPYTPSELPDYRWQWSIALVNVDNDNSFNPAGVDMGYKRILVRVQDPENRVYEIWAVVTNFP